MTTIPFGNDADLTRAAAKVGSEKPATLNPCAEQEAEIARLRAENEHLKAWLETRSEIIEGADANRESWRKEAVRLKAEKARLTAELENWRKRGASVVANVAGLVKEVDRLTADKERLVEAIKTIRHGFQYAALHRTGKIMSRRDVLKITRNVLREVQHD